MSNITILLSNKLRSSKSECKERVATWGLDQRFPPSSTSSSNLIHLGSKTFCYQSQTKKILGYNYKYRKNIIKYYVPVSHVYERANINIYLAVSFHSTSPPSWTSSSISENSGCDSCVPSSSSSPRMNCTRCAGGVTEMISKFSINIQ